MTYCGEATVGIGDSVTLYANGALCWMTVLPEDDRTVRICRPTPSSAVGQALLGSKRGDEIAFLGRTFTVIEVSPASATPTPRGVLVG